MESQQHFSWRVRQADGQPGPPLEERQLFEMARAGTLQPNTLIFDEARGIWMSANSHPALAAILMRRGRPTLLDPASVMSPSRIAELASTRDDRRSHRANVIRLIGAITTGGVMLYTLYSGHSRFTPCKLPRGFTRLYDQAYDGAEVYACTQGDSLQPAFVLVRVSEDGGKTLVRFPDGRETWMDRAEMAANKQFAFRDDDPAIQARYHSPAPRTNP